MPEVKLSQRLELVLSMIPFGSLVADVGADHGRLAVAACQRGSSPRAVAIDTSERAVRLIRRTAGIHAVENRVDARHGSGVAPLVPHEVETVVIAGMGADRIISILTEGASLLESLQWLVLSPNRGDGALRAWLRRAGWRLEDERIVEDRSRYYVVVRAARGDAEEPYLAAASALVARAAELGKPEYRTAVREAIEGLDVLGPVAVARSDPAFRTRWRRTARRLRSAAEGMETRDSAHVTRRDGVIRRAGVFETALALTELPPDASDGGERAPETPGESGS